MTQGNVKSLHQAAADHLQAGRTAQTIEILLQIANAYPNEPKSRFLLGFICQRDGRLVEALDWLNKAIRIDPAAHEPYLLVGNILRQQGHLPEAVDAYHKLLARSPSDTRGLNNLARTLLEMGKVAEAIPILQKVISISPSSAIAANNLGDAYRAGGDLAKAMEQFQKAISLDPNCAEAHGNLGIVFARSGNSAQSIASIQRAISIDPRRYGPHFNLARVFQDCGRLDEALRECQIAVEIRPDSADAHNLLGNLWGIAGWIPQCIASQRKAVEVNPGHAAAHSNLLLSLQYLSDKSPGELLWAHLQWAGQHATVPAVHNVSFHNDRNANRRLRVGYVSPNFNNHSVAYFFEPVLANHDRALVETFCYSDAGKGDATTARLRGLANHWREIAGKSDVEVMTMIHDDAIDILVDLAGHTSNNRMPMFARRPAPVQMSWIGYPATTGLKTIDYRLTDPIADPPGTGDDLHTEKLLRIEGGCWAYQAPPAPPVGPFPAIQNGHVTFGSFNNLPKVTPAVMQVWSRILNQVPSSRLLLKSAGLRSRLGWEYVLKHFGQLGIGPERLELVGWTPTTESHLQMYDRVDIALDTFPYNGTTTTCEALWMGVPVIALAGSTHVSRVGAALLTHVQLTDWIANDVEAYVALAVRLARDLNGMTEMRPSLRQRLADSPLCDSKRLAKALEQIYQQAWATFCGG